MKRPDGMGDRPQVAGPPELEHPVGAVPAISSGAMGLLATLVAFIAYADFRVKPDAPWTWGNALPILLALCAVVFLAAVPLLATRPQRSDMGGSAVQAARRSFALGAGCAILAIASFVVGSLLSHRF